MSKRILNFIMLVATIVTAASAYELTITQLDMSKFGTYPHQWEFAAFDFKTQTLYPVSINRAESSNNIVVEVYNLDFSTIQRSFTITIPQGYSIIDKDQDYDSNNELYRGIIMMSYEYGSMKPDEGGPSIYFSRNLFTKRELFECVVCCSNNNNEKLFLIVDENSNILGEIPSDIVPFFWGQTMNPIYVEGRTIFSNGLIIKDESSGINSVNADSNPSSVSPNPSNGAASIEVNWDYTLLDDALLNVIDMEGKLVHTQTIKSGSRKTHLKTSRFAPGTYIYVVQGSNGYTTTGKLIIN